MILCTDRHDTMMTKVLHIILYRTKYCGHGCIVRKLKKIASTGETDEKRYSDKYYPNTEKA